MRPDTRAGKPPFARDSSGDSSSDILSSFQRAMRNCASHNCSKAG